MSFDPGGDTCLQLFAAAQAASGLDFPRGGHVLEIGCAEADWLTPMRVARGDLTLDGLDWRACERSAAHHVWRDDVLTTQRIAPGSLDAVVLVSTLEHIGLGHYDADPRHDEGDAIALVRIHQWLAPGGFVYFDVPYASKYTVIGTECRVYSGAALRDRLGLGQTWRERWRGYVASDAPTVVQPTPPTLNGRRFDYVACWWEPV